VYWHLKASYGQTLVAYSTIQHSGGLQSSVIVQILVFDNGYHPRFTTPNITQSRTQAITAY